MMKGPLRNTYLILIGLLILCFVLRFAVHSEAWLKGFSLDVAAEIVGILLVVFSVDRVIDAEREQERRKLKEVAFHQLRKPLLRHIYCLLNLAQGPKSDRLEGTDQALQTLFDPDYFSRVAQINLSEPSAAGQFSRATWLDYLFRECLQLRESLNLTVEKYSQCLQPETIDMIEDVINSPFIWSIIQYPKPYHPGWESQTVALAANQTSSTKADQHLLLSEIGDLLREHVQLFLQLVQFYNDNVATDKQLRVDDNLLRGSALTLAACTKPEIENYRL